jgi:hypothetical protein
MPEVLLRMLKIPIAILLGCLVGCAAAWAQPSRLAGEWDFTTVRGDDASRDSMRLSITAEGDKALGATSRGMKLEIALHGSDLTIQVFGKEGKPQGTFTGHLDGDTMTGDGSLEAGRTGFIG